MSLPDARTDAPVRVDAIAWVEWGVAIALTALVLVLHATFLSHAGALWRDEINTLAFAQMPSLAKIGSALPYDSFPLLPTLLLRGWLAAGGGASDASIRLFGFLAGVGGVAAVWRTSRWLRCPVPLFSLALLGLNPIAVRATDSIRPYGVGVALMVLTLGMLWRAVETPTPRRLLASGVLGVLSVQCLYPNAFLLLGGCVAAAIVAAGAGRWKTAGAIVLVGVAAAASLLPYGPSLAAAADWNIINRMPTSVPQLLSVLAEALGNRNGSIAWAWVALGVLCLVVAIREQTRGKGTPPVALFSAAALVVCTVTFLVALKATGLPTQPWYYVPLLMVVAPLLDATSWATSSATSWAATTAPAWRIGRLVLVLALAGAAWTPAWKAMHERQTNVDIVAAAIARAAAPGDLIVLYPWYYGVSFQRYDHGSIPWITLPPLDDLSIHRFDLLKAAMTQPRPFDPVLEGMSSALRSGHRVWLIGELPFLEPGQEPGLLPPAPHEPWGWSSGPYLGTWGQQAAYLLQMNAQRIQRLPPADSVEVSRFEDVQVVVADGWR